MKSARKYGKYFYKCVKTSVKKAFFGLNKFNIKVIT